LEELGEGQEGRVRLRKEIIRIFRVDWVDRLGRAVCEKVWFLSLFFFFFGTEV
jgi:hypothetical protein